jgi:TolB-like protein
VPETSKAVFLSYASQDAEPVRRICDALREAGIEVWFDQSELRGGDAWDHRIRRQVADCALFVPVISAHTQARPEGYFRLEWDLADQRSHMIARSKAFIVPVCMDDTPQRGAEVPDSFLKVQWTRLPDGSTPIAFVERVSHLLSREPAQAPTETSSPARAMSNKTVARRHVRIPARWTQRILIVIAALAVIGGCLAINRFVRSKRPAVAEQVPASPSGVGASTQSAAPEKSIAVLPFTDMSERKDQEYFADGMAEEILNLLVKIPELKVIARTSSFQFKGKSDDLRKIGTTLGAAYVVEGSVRRSGDHFRVTAQLIDARDGAHRWSETYDRDIGDVLRVQAEVAASLVRALQLEVTGPLALSSRSSPRSNEAYDIYLRGLHAKEQFDQHGEEEAVADFQRALQLDPAFVEAAESLAVTLANMAYSAYAPPQIGWEQTRIAAQSALKLNPRSALGHAVLGIVHVRYDWDWPAADREFKEAMALSANLPIVLNYASMNRMALGDWNGAAQLMSAASTLDPLDPGFEYGRGVLYLRMGRMADAENAFRRMLDTSPTFEEGHFLLGATLLLQGKTDAALLEMRQETRPAFQIEGFALAYHTLQRPGEADAALARLAGEHANDSAMQIAETYAFRGQKAPAFEWLEKAFAQKDVHLWSIKGDPLLKSLESDSRYQPFLRKMNLAD